MSLLKTRTTLDQMILAPAVKSARGCVCVTCGRLVDSESLVEGEPGWGKTWCKVLVKHHGAEELRTFDFGSTNWDEYDLKSHMMRANWFDPTSHEGTALGVKIANPGDHVDMDAPAKPYSILGADGRKLT